MALSFLYLAFLRTIQILSLRRSDDSDLALEVVMLRHEVAVLRRQVARPVLRPSDRALLAGLSQLMPRAKLRRFFVQPDTLLRWHRDLVRRKWTYPKPAGRPRIPVGTVQVVIRLARENPTWGYRRIHGELSVLGIDLAAASVWNILQRHRLDPVGAENVIQRPRNLRGLRPDGRRHEQPRPAKQRWTRGRPSARSRDPRSGRQTPRHP